MSVMAYSTLGNETERNETFVHCEMRNLYFAKWKVCSLRNETLLPVIDFPLVNRICHAKYCQPKLSHVPGCHLSVVFFFPR